MARVRRGRSYREYARRAPVRDPYDYVLIICEGSKTEPNYLNSLKAFYKLSSTNIRVENAAGTDPLTIVVAAEAAIRSEEPYDRVYCVFDRDGHSTYDAALTRLQKHKSIINKKLFAITSIPCFEVWVLLHFIYTTSAFNAVGNRSSCDNVIEKLKKSIAGYTKGNKDVFALLSPHTDTAIANAKKLAAFNVESGSQNPATLMHDLVEYLRDLRKPKEK